MAPRLTSCAMLLRWLAMTQLAGRLFWIAARIATAGLCCLGVWCSWKLARADYLARLDTESSLRAAIRLEPDAWRYYVRLADFDERAAQQLLERSLQLDSYDAAANIDLGLYYESVGNYPRAEKLLLNAFAVDHTFAPRWALANFYFRRDNVPAFWAWARSTAEIPSDDAAALFELCWRESPDPERISREILNDNPELVRQFIVFLITKNQAPAAARAAQRLIRDGNPRADASLMLRVIDWLIAAGDGTSANTLWRTLIDQHWLVADRTVINNPNFARDPLPVSFDWSIPSYDGLHSWPGPEGLESEFTGVQPEACIIAEQTIMLAPGRYSFDYTYRTSGIPPGTGLQWQIIDAKSGSPLAASPDLSSDNLQNSELTFSVPEGVSLLQVRLAYQRAIGTPRVSGTLVIRSIRIGSHI